jgi:hypothetical protein
MHDCDDVDALGLDAIQEAVGKLRNKKAPESTSKRRAAQWELR